MWFNDRTNATNHKYENTSAWVVVLRLHDCLGCVRDLRLATVLGMAVGDILDAWVVRQGMTYRDEDWGILGVA